MELTHYRVDGPKEVETVVVSVMNYRVIRQSDNPVLPFEQEKAYMADRVTHELLDGLRQFVRMDVDPVRRTVTAQISMPYVRDSLLAEKEKEAQQLHRDITGYRARIGRFEKLIKWHEQPWWKKIFRNPPTK